MRQNTYLDAAATTPLDPRVAETVAQALRSNPGNPASLHGFGREARRVVEDARERVAALLHLHPREVIFTASATEANNTAIAGLAKRAGPESRRVVASPIEHPSVIEAVRRLETEGFSITWMPVHPDGRVDVEASASLLGADVALTVLMAVNNETGIIQDVAPWAELCAAARVPLHSDWVQATGRLEEDIPKGVSTAALSGHKIHGPTGAAILVVRDDAAIAPLLVGGAQERNRRAGTECVPAIAGLAQAMQLCVEERDERIRSVDDLDGLLSDALTSLDLKRNGSAERVSAISNVRFPRPYGETLLMHFDLRGIAVSLGSACSSGAVEPSHVLRSMGLTSAESYASLRVSCSHRNTPSDIERFADAAREITASKPR